MSDDPGRWLRSQMIDQFVTDELLVGIFRTVSRIAIFPFNRADPPPVHPGTRLRRPLGEGPWRAYLHPALAYAPGIRSDLADVR